MNNKIPDVPVFKYKTALAADRPKHEKYDDFWLKHPPMDLKRRAKIFSPFDALKGFSEAIEAASQQNG